jgi:hypothetical protein
MKRYIISELTEGHAGGASAWMARVPGASVGGRGGDFLMRSILMRGCASLAVVVAAAAVPGLLWPTARRPPMRALMCRFTPGLPPRRSW